MYIYLFQAYYFIRYVLNDVKRNEISAETEEKTSVITKLFVKKMNSRH
jgi:hypothetical protein